MKSYFAQFRNKIKKLFLSSESSQENVHSGFHFWKTDIAACKFQNFSIYFKQNKWNKLHLPSECSQENIHDGFIDTAGLLQKLWNKINKKVVSAFRMFRRKCLYKEVHFCKSYWVLPPTFWKKNSTVVISKLFSKSFETMQIKKLSLLSERF